MKADTIKALEIDLPFTATYEYIERRFLIHDSRYQRTRLRKDHIEAIAASFNPDIFGVLHVVRKDDAHYAVVDGWHRVSAIDLMGRTNSGWGPHCQLPCLVHQTLNEALTFVGLSQARPLTPLEKLKARYAGGDQTAMALVSIVQDCGLDFAFDHQGHQDRTYVSSVQAIESIYAYNPDYLRWTLQTVLAAWGPDAAGLHSAILNGVTNFAVYAGLDGFEIDTDRLISALAKTSPDKLRRRAQSEFAETVTSGIALVVLELYNKESARGRLPQWTHSKLASFRAVRAAQTVGPEGMRERLRKANAALTPEVRRRGGQIGAQRAAELRRQQATV